MNDLDQLMRAFHFTPDDLNANMQGRLSKRQRQCVKDAQSNLIAQLLGVLALLFIFSYFYRPALVCVMIYLVFMGLAYFAIRRDTRIELDNPIEMACGVLAKLPLIEDYRRMTRFQIILENKLFDLTSREYDSLKENKPYCAYYLPKTYVIMSIRPLQSIPENPFEEEN